MWYILILTVVCLQFVQISSVNETCWPTANNLTCVLNDLLLGYNKQLRPNHTGRIFFSKSDKICYLCLPRRSNSCSSLYNDNHSG
jgi:hypothetical protein